MSTVRPIDPAAHDRELVAAAQAGDRDALDQLLRRHYDRVHAVCRRILGRDADAADATQDALIAAVRGLPRFDGNAAFGTWLHRIATNTCLDHLRRAKRRPIAAAEVDDHTRSRDSVGAPAFDAGVIDRMVLDEAIAELPDEFRVAVVLRDIADLDYADIAATLDIPIGTVRSRISRGRAALARRLGNQLEPTERPTPADE